MDKNSHLDFLTSIVLIILSLFIMADSVRMARDVGGAFYSTPGMTPVVLGAGLLIASLVMLKRSLHGRGFGGNLTAIREWARAMYDSHSVREMALGIAILAVYTFVLVPKFPFWLSNLVFLVFLMGVLRATSFLNSVIISAITVGILIFTFQVAFHVPLP